MSSTVFPHGTEDSSQILKELPTRRGLPSERLNFCCGKRPSRAGIQEDVRVTLVAILRKNKIIEHRAANFRLEGQDIVYFMGRRETGCPGQPIRCEYAFCGLTA
jgi:K+/H+ antiporter YhaU regulatory subunit KhtT